MYFKKVILYLFLVIVFVSCDDIDRDNILDPKNPASERPQVITIEAFVNTSDSLPNNYNEYLLNALDDLESKYSEKITVTEHHRRINGGFDDGYILTDSEILYENYFQSYNSGIKGVPDVFINGIEARIQGASSEQSVLYRLQQAIDSLISKNSYFTIEPNILSNGSEFQITAKIARLGSSNAEDLKLKAVIIEQFDNDIHKRVVTEILKSQEINSISNGDIKEFDLGTTEITQNNKTAIFMITSDDEIQIFQSIKAELN